MCVCGRKVCSRVMRWQGQVYNGMFAWFTLLSEYSPGSRFVCAVLPRSLFVGLAVSRLYWHAWLKSLFVRLSVWDHYVWFRSVRVLRCLAQIITCVNLPSSDHCPVQIIKCVFLVQIIRCVCLSQVIICMFAGSDDCVYSLCSDHYLNVCLVWITM